MYILSRPVEQFQKPDTAAVLGVLDRPM
jgi:hypothetical protein